MADNQNSKISQTPNSVPRPDPDPEKDAPPDSRPTSHSLDYQEQKIINNSTDPKTTPIDPVALCKELFAKVEYLEAQLKSQSTPSGVTPTDTHAANQHKPSHAATPTTNRTNSRVAISQSGNIVNGNCQGPLINGNVQAPVLTGGQHTTQNFYQSTPKEKVIKVIERPVGIVLKEKDDPFGRGHKHDPFGRGHKHDPFERRHKHDKKKKRHYDKYGDPISSSEDYDGYDPREDYDGYESSEYYDGYDSDDDPDNPFN